MEKFDAIPQELKDLKQWVCWKGEKKADGKTTKFPVNPYTMAFAKSNDESTWATFKVACEVYEHNQDSLQGVGFMFKDGYFGVDLDDCSGDLQMEFVNALESYAEFSQSGDGIHVICKGKLPEGQRRRDGVEMYENGRFFVMTGKQIGNYEITDGTERIKPLHEKYLGDKHEKPNFDSLKTNMERHAMSDEEVFARAKKSKQGKLFVSLMNGDFSGLFNSQSEADMSLANILAFWCGRDAEQMDRIFRMSGLYRDKWDRKTGKATYGELTIFNACRDCTNVYDKTHKDNKNVVYKDAESGNIVSCFDGKYFELTDKGNAERINYLYGENIRFNCNDNAWQIFNGKFWEIDETYQIHRYVEKTQTVLKNELQDLPDEEKEEKAIKKAFSANYSKFGNSTPTEKMLKALQRLEGVACSKGDFNKNETLLNVQNGIVDLKTGELHPHNSIMMQSKITSANLDRQAKANRWEQFLNEIFLGDVEMIDYIQKQVGYSLSGGNEQQCVFVCVGDGANGKSVFLNVLQQALGSYSMNADVNSLLCKGKRSGSSANQDIARLCDARFVTTSEPNEDDELNEGLIKQLTGNDTVTARFLYGKEFEFIPKFKIWLATNHIPKIKGTDNGIWRRIKVIPFKASFDNSKQDKQLFDKLLEEKDAILTWAIEGFLKMQKEGIRTPKVVEEVTNRYRDEMDEVGAFLRDETIDSEHSVLKASTVFAMYKTWATRNGFEIMSGAKFGKEVAKKYERKRKSDGLYYFGIKQRQGDGYVY